ncbi:MAG: PqqD family peptide modification chaperone [Thermoproteota archaeon]
MIDVSNKTIDEKAGFTLNSHPYAPPELFSKELEPGVWLLLDPEMPNWVVVDPLGKEVIELCNGKRDLKEIIEILCKKYNGNFDASKNNIIEFVNKLAEKNFLSAQPFIYYPLDKSEWKALTSLWINVTHACNLRCLHCFRTAGEAIIRNELSTQEICGIIDEFVRLKGGTIVFSGGEPLLRRDIIDILDYAKKRGVPEVHLLTNGTLITSEIARRLKKLEPMSIQVSIDGSTAETHNKIRGEGSFERVINGIRRLKEAGFNRSLTVAMTIMKINKHEIEDFVSFAEKLGANGVHFPVFQDTGRGLKNRELLNLSPDDVREVFQRLAAIWRRQPHKVRVSLNLDILKFLTVVKINYCGAGVGLWSIEPDGRVQPCAGLSDRRFTAGNIRKQSLKEIISKSPITKKFRSLDVQRSQCASCELRFVCGGGCYVRNYVRFGNLINNTRSPSNCDFERTWYWELLKTIALNNIKKEVQP